MTRSDLLALLPLIVPVGAAVLLLVLASVRRSRGVAVLLAVLGLGGGLATLPLASGATGPVMTLLLVDPAALLYQGMILASSLAVVPMTWAYLRGRGEDFEELMVLVLLATVGAELLAASTHLASFFLGLEILSLSLYALIAWLREPLGAEAAFKYLVLAAASSAALVFGMALLYAATGELTLRGLSAAPGSLLVQAGWLLLLAGVGFKLAVVPFHLWAPDVYQGAPAPISTLVATVSKAGVVAVLARWSVGSSEPFLVALAILAGASMVVGNLLAVTEPNVKRLLGYSSIAHLGYLLVAVVAGAQVAVAFYLAAYLVTTLGAFGTVALLSRRGFEAEDLAGYRGLLWRHPAVALLFAAMLLSLAGIPLTAGFVGKLFVLLEGLQGALWVLVALLVLGSVIGLFYYLRVLATMFQAPGDEPLGRPVASVAGWLPLGAAAVLLLVLGVYPGPVVALLAWATAGL